MTPSTLTSKVRHALLQALQITLGILITILIIAVNAIFFVVIVVGKLVQKIVRA